MAQSEKSGAEARRLVAQLVVAAKGDTLYWDVYLRRAAAYLAPVFSRDLYRLLQHGDAAVAKAKREGARALNRSDWKGVEEAAAEVRDLQRAQTEHKADMGLGQVIYDLSEVPIDPFSPGFDHLFHGSLGVLEEKRADLVAALRDVEQADPERRDFYAGRRSGFEALRLSWQETGEAEESSNPEALRRQAMTLLERGDVDQVSRIAAEIIAAEKAGGAQTKPGAPGKRASAQPSGRVARTRDTAPRIVESAVSKASKLGLTLEFRESNVALGEFFARNAWHPSFPSEEKFSDGGLRIETGPESLAFLREAPDATRESLREILSMFALHPYVNSAGVRYLPRLDGEWLLVEDFPEDKVPDTSPLLDALNLPHRRGLSRAAIERALLERGANVIEESLGLDPRAYRMICIPVDVYTYLGQRRGWGAQPCWTHFDGYQVLLKGGQRALVGGDVRFGGLLDLCSISSTDEREGMILRLAVVHRERMAIQRS